MLEFDFGPTSLWQYRYSRLLQYDPNRKVNFKPVNRPDKLLLPLPPLPPPQLRPQVRPCARALGGHTADGHPAITGVYRSACWNAHSRMIHVLLGEFVAQCKGAGRVLDFTCLVSVWF